jgi:hypothetical protein
MRAPYKSRIKSIGNVRRASQLESVMGKRSSELEMYTVFDPRVSLLKDLQAGQWPVPVAQPSRDPDRETARRDAQWATWQMDRSWPERSGMRTTGEGRPVADIRRNGLPWILCAAGFVAVGIVAAGLLAVGIERGLL